MKLLPSILFTFSLFAVSAHAVTIIFDDFNRPTAPLAGSPTSGPGGLWVGGGANYGTNGSVLAITSSPTISIAYQNFIPSVNTTYTLSADFRMNAGAAADWIGMGFGGQVGNGDALLLTNAGTAYAFETGSATGVGYASNTGIAKGNFAIVLTTGNLLSNSHVEYFRNGTSFGAYHSTDATLFNRVFLQDAANVAGNIDNFTLTAVPEVSSALLGVVGIFGLVIRRRRC
jgi:hypothetical protein